MWIPGPLPLDCTASLHTSSRSTEVPHSVPWRLEEPTHLGVSPHHNHTRENLPGATAPHFLHSKIKLRKRQSFNTDHSPRKIRYVYTYTSMLSIVRPGPHAYLISTHSFPCINGATELRWLLIEKKKKIVSFLSFRSNPPLLLLLIMCLWNQHSQLSLALRYKTMYV